ncbi:MAG: sulfite exporter TauE/SafE family protein, partial [Planctomycetes bacterium]|nr:sulfite exporter TauE/SafE family protein [Planctomycetota bacterium]
MELTILLLALGFAISLLSGFLGIGGGILMAPALLYLPPILGVGAFDMKQVTGLTITQTLFA